eukprot:COSAG05_NODE_39_length_27555_cov_750.282925_15_plen_126_part_00
MVAGLGVGFLAGPLVAAAAAGNDNGDSGGGGAGGARTTTQLPESASVSRATDRLRLERSVMKRLVSELGAVATAAASKAATAPVAAGVDEGNGGEGNSSASSQTSKNNTACGAHELLRALVSFLL